MNLSRWNDVPTPLISDGLQRFGCMDPCIRQLSGDGLVGPAFPVETMEGDSATLHHAVNRAPEGSVLVVDAKGLRTRAVWGEVLSTAAEARGLRGLVLHGAIRDLDAIRQRGFPVFAMGSTPAGPHKGWQGRIGEPISCGGVPVHAGDLVVGDADGVVIIPASHVDDVYRSAMEKQQQEDGWIGRIEAGESTLDILDLRKD